MGARERLPSVRRVLSARQAAAMASCGREPRTTRCTSRRRRALFHVRRQKALAKRFKKDPVMRRMLRQCVEGEGAGQRPGADMLLESRVLKDACPDKSGAPPRGQSWL